MPTVFEPAISANEHPQTYALDRAANGISFNYLFSNHLILQRYVFSATESVK